MAKHNLKTGLEGKVKKASSTFFHGTSSGNVVRKLTNGYYQNEDSVHLDDRGVSAFGCAIERSKNNSIFYLKKDMSNPVILAVDPNGLKIEKAYPYKTNKLLLSDFIIWDEIPKTVEEYYRGFESIAQRLHSLRPEEREDKNLKWVEDQIKKYGKPIYDKSPKNFIRQNHI